MDSEEDTAAVAIAAAENPGDSQIRRSVKTFDFDEFPLPPLKVVVPEVLDGQYGMYTWPSSPVLARYIWTHQPEVQGKYVLELGSGTSLAGVTAALVGASAVVLSEQEGKPQLLDNCRRTCLANDLKHKVLDDANAQVSVSCDFIQIVGLSWACFGPTLLSLPPFDLILGSDCFYDEKDYEDIIATVAFLMDRNPACRFWTTYQERNSAHNILPLLRRWNLTARSIPLETFDGERITVDGKLSPPAHSIHMLDIWRDT